MCSFSCLHVQFKSGKSYFESTFVEEKLEEDTSKQDPELCSRKQMGSRCLQNEAGVLGASLG